MYCSNCGKKLSEDDFFCSNCGTPVLRQDLFSDNDDDYSSDAFEETRLFTAEELGQFLNDPIDEAMPIVEEAYQPSYPDVNQYQQPVQNEAVSNSFVEQNEEQASAKKSIDAKEMVSGALGSANALVGKFKSRRSEAKAKKADKKQADMVESELQSEPQVEEASDGPIPFKKIVFPVIVLGLIIGLVFGLILVQPWNNDNEADTTATGTVMVASQFDQM